MNLQDVAAHWVALHEALGIGAPLASEAQYLQMLQDIEALVDATNGNEDHPLWGLIQVAGEQIRDYEARHHPWPDNSTPASVLAALMQEHGLRQSDLPEVGSQGVVSEVLAGKRALNLRQVRALSRRFGVPIELFTY